MDRRGSRVYTEIERFNRTYREDVLDLYLSETLQEVREVIDDWIDSYNYERPHDSLNDMTPMEYLLKQLKFLRRCGSKFGIVTREVTDDWIDLYNYACITDSS